MVDEDDEDSQPDDGENADDEPQDSDPDIGSPVLDFDEIEQDPFTPQTIPSSDDQSLLGTQPAHILAIYAAVTWLHLQYHLPRAGCHALLLIFSLVVGHLAPKAARPLVTPKAAERAIGLNTTVHILPRCPNCKDVNASADWVPDLCTACNNALFIDSLTSCGHTRKQRIPIVRYPYLSISEQLPSIIGVPGFEKAAELWRNRDNISGRLESLFDGQVAQQLRGHDGKPFFSNLEGERDWGPNNELRLGLMMGVDW